MINRYYKPVKYFSVATPAAGGLARVGSVVFRALKLELGLVLRLERSSTGFAYVVVTID